MGLLTDPGLETRSFTEDALTLLESAVSLGGQPHPEHPAVDLVARAFAAAKVDPLLPFPLADVARDALTNRAGFVGLIELDDTAAIRILRADRATLRGGPRNLRYDLSIKGGDQSLEVSNVSEAQVFRVRYSDRGSVYDVNPELARARARLLRALADESGTPTGQIVALGSREERKTKDTKKSIAERLRGLRGGLATFLSPPSGSGGQAGSAVFQPRGWSTTRLGADPPASLVDLHAQLDRELSAALGVHPVLLGTQQGTAAAIREAMRLLIATSLGPLARAVEAESRRKLLAEVKISFPTLVASDIASRSRAYGSLVGAGMDPPKAARIVGFEE